MPYVDRDDTRLKYDVADLRGPWVRSDETIVFCHGIAAGIEIWNPWLPVLADSYRVVRFDLRGYGGSVPKGEYTGTFDDLVADVLAVADAASAEQFHLVGESIGGTIAMAAALAHPGRIKTLTITNAAAHGPRLENVRVWRDMVAEMGQAEWARRMMGWRFFPDSLDQGRWDWFYEQHATCSMDATLHLAELLLGADIRDRLPELHMPMLVISPDSSPFISVDLMADIHKAVPSSEMLVVPHSKHGLPLSHGSICAAALRNFLQRNEAATSE